VILLSIFQLHTDRYASILSLNQPTYGKSANNVNLSFEQHSSATNTVQFRDAEVNGAFGDSTVGQSAPDFTDSFNDAFGSQLGPNQYLDGFTHLSGDFASTDHTGLAQPSTSNQTFNTNFLLENNLSSRLPNLLNARTASTTTSTDANSYDNVVLSSNSQANSFSNVGGSFSQVSAPISGTLASLLAIHLEDDPLFITPSELKVELQGSRYKRIWDNWEKHFVVMTVVGPQAPAEHFNTAMTTSRSTKSSNVPEMWTQVSPTPH
jgi:hypothetical protein